MQTRRDIIAGVILMCFSVIYFISATTIHIFQGVGKGNSINSRTVPYMWAICLLILSTTITIRAIKNRNAQLAENKEVVKDKQANFSKALKENYAVIGTFALLTVYIWLLTPVGFFIMTALYITGQTIILTTPSKLNKKTVIMAAVIGVVSSFIFDYAFVRFFTVMLPRGILGF